MTVADRIGVMDAGRLEQVATPRELYEAPGSRWVAEFVGDVNIFEGEIERQEAGRLLIATRDAGTLAAAAPRQPAAKPNVCVAIRPEKIHLASPDSPAPENTYSIDGRVRDVIYLGLYTRYLVELDGGGDLVVVEQNLHSTSMDVFSARGRRVRLVWKPDHNRLVKTSGAPEASLGRPDGS